MVKHFMPGLVPYAGEWLQNIEYFFGCFVEHKTFICAQIQRKPVYPQQRRSTFYAVHEAADTSHLF